MRRATPKPLAAVVCADLRSGIAERLRRGGVASGSRQPGPGSRSPQGVGAADGTRGASRTAGVAFLRMPAMTATGPVSMSVIWRVPAQESQGIIGALQHLLPHTRAAPGCDG